MSPTEEKVMVNNKIQKELSTKSVLASGLILIGSTSGLLISRSLSNTVSQDVRVTIASICFIILAFLCLLGVKFMTNKEQISGNSEVLLLWVIVL